MKKLRFLLSVTNDDNDYQIEEAAVARAAAEKAGIDLDIASAGDNGVVQSQQILARVQSPSGSRPDAILFEPAGSTALPQVARAAATAGIGWAVLSREADYTVEMRAAYRVPVFTVTPDHKEIGRIQGQQLAALLPEGGLVLNIQGPSQSMAAQHRHMGLLETKPESVELRVIKGHWSESSAHKAVSSWLRLSTSRDMQIAAVCAQDDSMAMGARKAFEECAHEGRERWLKVPFLGCDGLSKTGQEWVRRNLLAATVFSAPTAGLAIEIMMQSIESGTQPALRTFVATKSIPAIEELASQAVRARTTSSR